MNRDRALVPTTNKAALPQIYLSDSKTALADVYRSDPGDSGAGARLKWLASTCLAGVFGVGVIGITLYASMEVDDGSGVVSSIKRASLAAMAPVRLSRAATEKQTVAGQKSDRIQTTALGLSTRHIIHDSLVQRRGGREYIRIKPYARIVASLATAQPDEGHEIPSFNPYKLYVNQAPISDGSGSGGSDTADREVVLKVVELLGGILPDEDGIELRSDKVAKLVSEAQGNLVAGPFAMRSSIVPGGLGGLVQKAAYRPDDLGPSELTESDVPANTTVVGKSELESEDEVLEGSVVKSVKVRRGNTLMSILADAGAEKWQAKAIADAMAPVFRAKHLKAGQDVRFTLTPAPSDTGQMDPIKVSVFDGAKHKVTVARNEAGDYVASDEHIELSAVAALRPSQYPQRATLYTSLYHAALSQKIPAEMIKRLLKIHSYDTDYKQRVRAGDSFEVFFDLKENHDGADTSPGEMLFTALKIEGEMRRFYRFRTPDGIVDYYDQDGNSAKKFLMRKPVKGSRFTSGFGMRRHPLLRYRRMHTGVDWAARHGTPILAAGNGVVEAVGRKGGYGNHVRIRHGNGFKTAYSHMARFARGLRPGVKVRQGQVIGFVGSTGLSSGPHLHFEVLVNKRFVNPMTINVPRGRQLTGPLLAKFHNERVRIDGLMQRSPVTTRVAAVHQ
ncbi:MAG: peptidoglycan DD-metalloendopeptidase family protein [Methyloligellaceae bacterium]